MDKLEEMDKFLERFNLPKLNQEEIENINRTITSTEIESAILKLPTKNSLDDFRGEFYQILREELTPVLLILFNKIAKEGLLLNSLYEDTSFVIPKVMT